MGEKLSDPASDAAAYVDAAAALIGLPLDPAHRPGTVLNLQRIAEMAALVMAFPLPDDTEPAPVFLP
jgi:1-carboxybiuret hydrolase subunit AtzG-like